ncbi:electron transfer flavoprotein subunit alpha/FixB family protein [Ligilactobacillus sp. LYQ139]|uniref:electron transfer flavoprotein subunit alpha/FixB family protein n=1 Tax=Ligilactobacillus sp. LYQ139 TaxID=3378800 RepID=UPI0038550B01
MTTGWLFGEYHNGHFAPGVLELAAHTQKWDGVTLNMAVLGSTGDHPALQRQLQDTGIAHATLIPVPDDATIAQQAAVLAAHIRTIDPAFVLFSATPLGRSVAPYVQGLLHTGLSADCTDLAFKDGQLVQTKPAYGDNVACTIMTTTTPAMASVRPGVFPTPSAVPATSLLQPQVTVTPFPVPLSQLTGEKTDTAPTTPHHPKEATRIIALGRGAATPEGLRFAKQLAHQLDAAVMTTRPVSLLPGFGVQAQIGLTGQTIHPRLLITLGVSGSSQFLAGVKNAGTIIAVNTDPHAPIFDYADYRYVGDAVTFMQAACKEW